MLRTILIVDDESINREILDNMLSREYGVLAAGSGAEALAVLREKHSLVSAVLLDLRMPGMDGFEVLKAIRADELFQSIPVIVVTAMTDVESEEKAVALGAYGFVTKPYRSVLIKRHLNNAITFRESASLRNQIRRDELTRIPNQRGFTEQAETMIKAHPAGYYVLSCFDVDSFKVINDQYGTPKGDEVLKHIARAISDCVTPLGGICCRVSADDFAALYPTSCLGSDALKRGYQDTVSPGCISRTIGIRIGRYVIEDGSVSVSSMYDRAVLARESIRGKYDVYEAMYDEAMRGSLLREQQIVNEMGAALEGGQFEVWYQPQFNHASGAMIGAEALVRWRHPERGLVAPYEFIPVFERNGFIYSLDRYVWEQVCMNLRRWTDTGRNPLPVSVNISREDISKGDVVEVLSGLVRKYGLDISMLRLEITETAFAGSSELVASVVKRLIDKGFTVEIDDFGSGYSSLNTLKDVPAQIIKLDMKFLENSNDTQRGGNIIESVVRMAKWLGMSVIAEGVETLEQANYLRSIGCYYMQGYLYARPMPAAKYEEFCAGNDKEERLLSLETVENLDNNAFWDPESMDTLIFNSYIGGACIYEYHNGKIELLRATEKYAQVIGSAGMTVEDALKLDWAEHLEEESGRRVIRDLEESIATKREITGEYIFLDLPNCPHETYLRSTMRVIASTGERFLVYCTNENVTAQRQAERRLREAAEQMRTLMNDTPGGFARMRMHPDGTGRTEYANEGFCKMLGMTLDEVLGTYSSDLMVGVHPDDLDMVMSEIANALASNGLMNAKYRLQNKAGEYVWLQVFARFVKAENGDTTINCYYADLTAQEKKGLSVRETMPFILSAIMETSPNLDFAKDKEFRYIFCSPAFARFAGQAETSGVVGKTDFELFPPETAAQFRKDDLRLFGGGESLIDYTEPIPSADGVQHYSVTSKYILRDSAGEMIGLYGSGRDITDTRAALDRLQLLTDSIPGGIATYAVSPDSMRITYFNDGFCDLFGCTREEYAAYSAENGVVSLVFPEDLPDIMRQLGELIAHGSPIDCTYRSRSLDRQSYRWLNMRGVLVERSGDTAFINAVLYDVTAQREAEQKARETAEQMTVIMESIRGGISAVTVGEDGQVSFAFANPRYYEILGYTREQFDAEVKNAFDLVFREDLDRVRAAVARVMTTHKPDYYEYRCKKRDGSTVYLRCNAACTSIAGVGDTVLLSNTTDITEIVTAREKEASAQRALLDNMPCGAALYEYDGERVGVIHLNMKYWELVGRAPKDYGSLSIFNAIHPDDRMLLNLELDSAIRHDRPISIDLHILCGESEYRPFHIAANIEKKESGGYLIYAAYTPISEREISVRDVFSLALSGIMADSPDIAFVKDADLHYVSCSKLMAEMAGLAGANEMIGKTDADILPAEFAREYERTDRSVLETGKPVLDLPTPIPGRDGALRDARTSKYPLRDSFGRIVGIYGIGRDVTEERMGFAQLKLINDSVPGGIATYSWKDGVIRITYCNDGFCRLFGGTREGLRQRGEIDPTDWVHNDDRAMLLSQIRALVEEDKPIDCVYRVRVIGGGYKWISQKAAVAERHGDTVLFNAMLLDVNERQLINEQLRISEEENHLAVQHGGSVVSRFDVAERTLSIAKSVAAEFSLPETISDVPYEPIRLGLVSPESADAYKGFFEAIINGSKAGTALYQQRYLGEWRWMEAKSSTIFSDEGKPVKAVISLFDVTDRLEKETIYRKWQHSLEDRAPESYTLFRINLNKNTSYETKEGLLFTYDVHGSDATFNERARAYAKQCVHQDDMDTYVAFANSDTMLASYYRGKRTGSLDYRELTPDGDFRWLRLTADLVESPNSTEVEAYLMYEDVDEAKRVELQTKALSETDPLTGLLNRATFTARVDRLLAASKPEVRHALMMLDIDGFKQVNDVFGHGAGDQALIELAHELRSVTRHDDIVARLGGDEFVVFMGNVLDTGSVIAKARQIRARARKSFSAEVRISVSVGIALSPRDGVDFETLYKKADSALYHVKGSGKDDQAVYSDNMEDEHLLPEPDSRESAGARPAEKKRRMLIVDDNGIDHALLQNIFRDDFIIEKARDGSSALIRLRHYGSAISVVLLDLMMPGMDGFAVLEKLQENAELRSIPVIIVSGDESRKTCLEAIRRGATDFVTKPVDIDLIRIRVQSAVSRAENERLRARNSLLEVQTQEQRRYESFLDSPGVAFIEYDWLTGEFTYCPSISNCLLGVYDERKLWMILLSDMVADTPTVQDMQQLAHRVADNRDETRGSRTVTLKTPSGAKHRFRFDVRKQTDEYGLTHRLVLTLVDLDYEVRDER